jgi:hypothetical protein
MSTIESYELLGRFIGRLNDASFARMQGFTGGPKQVRLLRNAHARAATLKRAELVDLGRLISDYLSPGSDIANVYGSIFATVSS